MRSRHLSVAAGFLLACALGAALVPARASASGPIVIQPGRVPPTKAPARTGGHMAPAGGQPSASVKGQLTLLYGDDHVFAIVPPQGWVVDDSSGLGSKIRVVLYPRGQKWSTAPTVMYSNPIHQDRRMHRTLGQMIERDIADFHLHAPKGKVTSGPGIRNVKGQQAEIRYFAPDGSDPKTAVAYFEEKDLVMLLVLESKSAAGMRSALSAFDGMVSSYQFVGSNMPTPTSARPGSSR